MQIKIFMPHIKTYLTKVFFFVWVDWGDWVYFASSEKSCTAMPPATLWTFRRNGLTDHDGHDKGTNNDANQIRSSQIICLPQNTMNTYVSICYPLKQWNIIFIMQDPKIKTICAGVHSGDGGYREKSTADSRLQFRTNKERQTQRKKRTRLACNQLQ